MQVVGEFEAEMLEQQNQVQSPPPSQGRPQSQQQQQPPDQQQMDGQGSSGGDADQPPGDPDMQQEADEGAEGQEGMDKQEVNVQLDTLDGGEDNGQQVGIPLFLPWFVSEEWVQGLGAFPAR